MTIFYHCKWRIVHLIPTGILHKQRPQRWYFLKKYGTKNSSNTKKETTWLFPWLQMSRSYRDISRGATIRIVSRRIDTVSIYRHIVSSLLFTIWHMFVIKSIVLQITVKSLNFMGMKFCGLTTLDMFVDTWICGFQIICNITKVKKYFVGS